MNQTRTNLPPHRHVVRKIGILAFPGVQVLDITGPLEVFSFANYCLREQGLPDEPAYQTTIFAERPGPIRTMSGLQIVAESGLVEGVTDLDTLLVPGGEDIDAVINNQILLDWLKSVSEKVNRLAAICVGAFALAECGILDGKVATTHWKFSARLAADYPNIHVDADRIFVRDGSIFTSGGVTSGIDLALALLEEDWGAEIALRVAQYLVVFLQRPGGQSQYSSYLANQPLNRGDLRELQAWMLNNPCEDFRVSELARRMSMSPRNFARIFRAETGCTVAKFVEKVRIDTARYYLLNTRLSIEKVREKSGFQDCETMRRTFLRHLKVNPSTFRARFSASAVSSDFPQDRSFEPKASQSEP